MRPMVVVVTFIALLSNARAAPTPETLYNEGQAAYDRGDYALAVQRWQEAYRLSKEPALLFNLAQAHRLANECEPALAGYRQFVAIDPTSEQRALAEQLVNELEGKCGAASQPLIVEPPSASPGAGERLKIVGIATGSAGAVSIVAGIALGHHGQTLGQEVTRACSVSCDWTAHRATDSAGRRDVAIGYALDGLGTAAVVGGALLYYLGERQNDVSVSRPQEGGVVVTWSGAW